MKKIYIIVDASSGINYFTDEPNVLFVTTNYQEAKNFFKNEIADWEKDMTNFESYSNIIDSYEDEDKEFTYECTDFESDTHRIIKLIESEIKE